MKKIKIIHVLHCVGGVDIYLRLILENINNNKFENIIIHGFNDTKHKFLDKNNQLVKNYNISIVREISLINDIKAIINTYKIVKNEKPDLIHCHSAKGGIIGRFVGFILNVNVLYTPHAFSYLSAETKFKKNIFLSIERIFANNNSILLPTSISELNKGINEVGYKKDKTRLFINSIKRIVNTESLTLPIELPANFICTVGRPSYQKNIELMVKIIHELNKENDLYLVIMGVGHHSDKLSEVNKLINKLNLNNKIILVEWTSRENVLNIIEKSLFYISTSRYEGLPYSVIESLALSKPCIVSDCDGNRDLIINNFNGFVIENENVFEYKEKIKLLLNNEILLEQFSKNAYKSFEDNYEITKNINLLESIYVEFSTKNNN